MTSVRADRIGALGEAVAARADDLEVSATAILGVPRRVAREDISLAVHRLSSLQRVAGHADRRAPLGTVALSLPGNAIVSNPLTAIAVSYLAGNATIVRMPQRRRAWAALLTELLEGIIDEVEWSALGGRDFVEAVAVDPDVAALVAFGGDEWSEHEALVRRTGLKLIFEGPGKDPFLVLERADAAVAARAAVRAACFNAGQACTSAERFYVVEALHEEFLDELLIAVGDMVCGDPRDEETEIGPLGATGVHRVVEQLNAAISDGAKVLSGRLEGDVATPTVVVDVDHGMDLMTQETFGPLLPVMSVPDSQAALDLATDSDYGLTASVFGGTSADVAELRRSHGVVYTDETWLEHRWRAPLADYGGRRRSGWVWEYRGDSFIRRDGPRRNLMELTTDGKS